MQQFQQQLQEKQKQQDAEEYSKSNLRVGGPKKGQGPGSPPPILNYLKIRIRNLFHVPLSVLNKSACILSDEAFIETLPVAWELLRWIKRFVLSRIWNLFRVVPDLNTEHVPCSKIWIRNSVTHLNMDLLHFPLLLLSEKLLAILYRISIYLLPGNFRGEIIPKS